jgi:hypothetical protein
MGFLRRLFGSVADGDRAGDGSMAVLEDDRQAVSVWIRLAEPSFENEREQVRVFALEDRIMRALDASGVGEHDTNDLEPGFLAIRCVGDDADAIVTLLRPLLDGAPPGSYLAVRRGPTGTGEERQDLE